MAAPAGAFRFVSSCNLPTDVGVFEMRVYKHAATGQEAIAMVARVRHGGARHGHADARRVAVPPSVYDDSDVLGSTAASSAPAQPPVLLRIQDQCMTSEIFGSLKCDCKQQLDFSMAAIQSAARVAWKRRSLSASASVSSSLARAASDAATVSADEADDRSSQRSGGGDSSSVDGGSGSSRADHRSSVASQLSLLHVAPAARSEAAAAGVATSDASAAGGAGGVGASPQRQLRDADVVGAVIYLLQEGRGIGLASKVAAYSLQEDSDGEEEADGDDEEEAASVGGDDEDGASSTGAGAPLASPSSAATPGGSTGSRRSLSSAASGGRRERRRGLDTVDANRHLGLPDDVREYGAVADILTDLGLLTAGAEGEDAAAVPHHVGEAATSHATSDAGAAPLLGASRPLRLLTNNPRKLAQLRALGVPVAARVPCHVAPVSPLAAKYLRAKAERMGHAIPQGLYAPASAPAAAADARTATAAPAAPGAVAAADAT